MTLPDPYVTEDNEVDTTLCSTCGQPSSFVDNRPGANPVGYCAADLPPTLQQAAASGHLAVADDELQKTGDEELVPTEEQKQQAASEKSVEKVAKAASKR